LLNFKVANGGNPLVVEEFYLSNGMQVIVIPNDRIPAVSHMVWYKIGAADEPTGKSGIAHVLEHLMFKATKTMATGEFSKIVERNGGQMNAFTSSNYTAYYQKIASDKLELVMQLESDRMRNLVFNNEEFEKEKLVVLEERRMRTENSPAALLGEQLNAMLYLNHHYGIPVIGWEHEVDGLTRGDVIDFYNKYYQPKNAVLIVEGDADKKTVQNLAEKYYGSIKSADIAVRNRPSEPPHIAERRVILKHPNVRQPSLVKKYLAPSQTSREHSEYAYPLLIASQILGGGNTSRLYQELVVKQKLATSVSVYYSDTSMDISSFSIYASPAPDVTLEVLEGALSEYISSLLNGNIEDEELKRAKNLMKSEAIYAREGLGSMANLYGVMITTGVGTDYLTNWERNIDAVNADIIAVAMHYVFQDEKLATGYLLGK